MFGGVEQHVAPVRLYWICRCPKGIEAVAARAYARRRERAGNQWTGTTAQIVIYGFMGVIVCLQQVRGRFEGSILALCSSGWAPLTDRMVGISESMFRKAGMGASCVRAAACMAAGEE